MFELIKRRASIAIQNSIRWRLNKCQRVPLDGLTEVPLFKALVSSLLQHCLVLSLFLFHQQKRENKTRIYYKRIFCVFGIYNTQGAQCTTCRLFVFWSFCVLCFRAKPFSRAFEVSKLSTMFSQQNLQRKPSTTANVLDLKELLERTAPKKPTIISSSRPVSQSSSLSSQPFGSQSFNFSQNMSSENLHPYNDSNSTGAQTKSQSQTFMEPSALLNIPSEDLPSNTKLISMTRQLNLAQKKLQKIQQARDRASKGFLNILKVFA